MKAKWLIPVLLLVLSCGKKEIIPSPSDARLQRIVLQQDPLVLEPGMSTVIHFTVQDAAYVFPTDVSDSACPLRLIGRGITSPPEVQLQSVTKDVAQGRYTAVIADTGTGTDYDLSVRLAIFLNEDTVVASDYFNIKSFSLRDPWQKTGLPVVYVNTENGQEINSKTEYVKGAVTIEGTKSLPGLPTATCRIRGRGNTTWTWPKKPYLIAFDEQQDVFGMHKHKRWVLLANFMDRTLMRNMVSMKVSSFMTHLAWTPGCVPVELVLNGQHKGTYLLIEQVRVDKDRVNISKEEGFLFELDFHYDNPVQWVDPHGTCWGMRGGIPFGIKYPDSDEITAQQKSYAKSYISQVASVVYGNGFADPDNGYAKYLDVDSFIDYWIVFEVMTNHELNNPGSVFFHKDKDGLLTAGPVWDFDWGVLSFNTSPQGKTGLVCGDAIWYSRLFKDPAFRARVKARFQELLPQLETIPDYMEECRALLKESAQLNFAMWNPADDRSQNGGQIINGDENLSFDAAIDRLKENYKTHLKVVGAKLN